MKAFFQNPIGFLVLLIVALVVVATYLETIIAIAAMVVLVVVIFFFVKYAFQRWGKGSGGGGTYCTNCPHPDHREKACNQCRCVRS
jgi:hypothetical protein